MNYIIYFDVAAVCVLITALIAYGIRTKMHSVQNTVYRMMIISVLVMAVSDILVYWNYDAEQQYAKGFLYFLKYCYIIAHTLVAVSFAIYSACLTGRLKKKWKSIQNVLLLPLAVIDALLAAEFFWPCVFLVDENNMYRRQWGLFVIYGFIIFYLIVGILYLVKYYKKTSSENLTASVMFVIVSLTAIVVQAFYPHLLIQPFALSMCVLLYLIAMEKPQELIDPEFKVYNQRALIKMAEEKFMTKERFPVLIIKIHNLKVLRQTVGADTINGFLLEMADFLKKRRTNMQVYHFSQSIFVLTLEKNDHDMTVSLLLKEIRDRFDRPWKYEDVETKFFIHIAYVLCPKDADCMDDFMDYIQYMRISSSDNRNVALRAADMNVSKQKREMRIRKMLSDAIENNGFEVFYQPIYSVVDKSVMSAEALVRLKDQSFGYISPEEFIPIAEKNGLIMKIGEFVFESVCRFIHEENVTEYGIQYIEINLSVVQCMQDNLAEYLTAVMQKYEIGPEQINLEITETAAAHTTDILEHNINILHEKGIRFSLDDYGSGYSNTDYLFQFPFRIVKIDKMILWEAFKNQKAMIALKNTIRMVKELGMEIVVEGVETQENVDYLKSQECDFLQGYYYSKPIPDKRFMEMIKNEKASC